MLAVGVAVAVTVGRAVAVVVTMAVLVARGVVVWSQWWSWW